MISYSTHVRLPLGSTAILFLPQTLLSSQPPLFPQEPFKFWQESHHPASVLVVNESLEGSSPPTTALFVTGLAFFHLISSSFSSSLPSPFVTKSSSKPYPLVQSQKCSKSLKSETPPGYKQERWRQRGVSRTLLPKTASILSLFKSQLIVGLLNM